jgi:kynurenine formamidase
MLFLRTGNGRRIALEGLAHASSVPGPGAFHVANMPFFHERGVAAIGSDTPNDRNKSDYTVIPDPVHAVALTALGLWIIDNCNLETLSTTCQAPPRRALVLPRLPACSTRAWTGTPSGLFA